MGNKRPLMLGRGDARRLIQMPDFETADDVRKACNNVLTWDRLVVDAARFLILQQLNRMDELPAEVVGVEFDYKRSPHNPDYLHITTTLEVKHDDRG